MTSEISRGAASLSPVADAARILLVDDDLEMCELLTLRLSSRGYRVLTAHNVFDALRLIGSEPIDTILLDLRLGTEDGAVVLDNVRKRTPEVPVIVITAHGSIETAVNKMRRGAFGFITKPFQSHDLLQQVAHAVESVRLRREVAGLRRVVGTAGTDTSIIGVSPQIEQVRELIARLAPTEATVLILGESGTGKELVARAIHTLSPRSSGPFVAVNCAALAADLLESTLFGHAKGAFTGAVADHEGLFGAARRGTLFLDEIGEAPPSVQAKLLRVLQERRYTRVGSTAEQEADVRILAATNRDLRQEIVERRFREDLFYRLHILPIVLPPLRERVGDLPLLAQQFLQRAAARYGVPAPRLSKEALDAICAHTWAGNVRELANAIEAAVLLACGGDEIRVEHLVGIGTTAATPRAALDDFTSEIARLLGQYAAVGAPALPSLREARDVLEAAYLDAALKKAGGSVAQAARLAGRNRTDFYDLLRRHGRSPSAARSD